MTAPCTQLDPCLMLALSLVHSANRGSVSGAFVSLTASMTRLATTRCIPSHACCVPGAACLQWPGMPRRRSAPMPGDRVMMGRSRFACTGCHQKRP